MKSLDGKVVAITGAASGIGRELALQSAERGARLAISDWDAEGLAETAALARERRAGDLFSDVVDVSDRTQVGAWAGAVVERFGGVDMLVNNAGFGTTGEFWTADPGLLQAQLDVNVTSVVAFTRAALPSMIEAGRGDIVNVASVAGLLPGRGSTYSGSKAYVVSFTEGLAGGLTGTGVRVQALCPGFVRTEFHQRAGIDMSSTPNLMWLDVDEVVRTSLADLDKGKVRSIPGLQYKVLATAGRLVPQNLVRKLTNTFGNGRGRT